MTAFEGMRWLKCDLQMQTPADRHHWTGTPLVAGHEVEAARAFADACCDMDLDIVGITDHNFLCRDFIPYLNVAFTEAEQRRGHKVTAFPGFEFEAAGVGRGVHVLCLFEPATDVAKVDAILTECGIAYPRVTSNGELARSDRNLKDILRLVQGTHGGVVILPHSMGNEGLFDNNAISEWLQKEQFINPELLAVEVPKPVSRMSQGFQKLFRSGDDCEPGWKRIRPIATLMSSDNKTLIEAGSDGRPHPNSIGYRYSWIKMSRPSIESLRQAFLDHESRIVLPDDVLNDTPPGERVRQAKIRSIAIRGASFLADRQIHFSPSMNCVIGGRGCGKSSLLEYLRLAFGKHESPDLDEESRARISRVRDTLNGPGAELEVLWESYDGVEDRILWRSEGSTVRDRELADAETYFDSLPLRFYSQQQLNRLTEARPTAGSGRQAQRLLELVDGFAKDKLDELVDEEGKVRQRVLDSFAELRRANALERELKRLRQEHQELERQWQARSEVQGDARRHQQLTAESQYISGVLGAPGMQFADVASLADAVAGSHVGFAEEDSPHATWLSRFDERVRAAKHGLARTIRDAVNQFSGIL